MIKKALALIGVISTSIFVVACSVESQHLTPTRGEWVGDRYVSEYLGLEFQLPNDWFAVMGVGVDNIYEGEEVIPAEAFDDDGIFIDMFALSDVTGVSHVHISFKQLPESMNISEIEILEEWLLSLENDEAFEMLEFSSETISIGDNDWYSIGGITSLGDGLTVETRMHAHIQGRYARMIRIVFRSDDIVSIDEIIEQYFSN